MGFLHYANRFAVFAADNSSGATPGIPGLAPGPNNHWYTYTVGPVFFAVMSTEAYFQYDGVAQQYAYLDAQLSAVDRAATPWVVVYGHRSIYCSCDGDCDSAATTVRLGPKGDGVYGMEGLFAKHKVDLFINGHEHDYERNYAVFQGKLATGASSGAPGGNASAPEVIENPTAPIYIIEGCAGDVEHHEPFTRPQPAYSAYRSNTYGYARMTVYNSSHMVRRRRLRAFAPTRPATNRPAASSRPAPDPAAVGAGADGQRVPADDGHGHRRHAAHQHRALRGARREAGAAAAAAARTAFIALWRRGAGEALPRHPTLLPLPKTASIRNTMSVADVDDTRPRRARNTMAAG